MPSLYFNNAVVEQTSVQKHHDKNFERKLSFTEHINDKINKKSRDYKALLLSVETANDEHRKPRFKTKRKG